MLKNRIKLYYLTKSQHKCKPNTACHDLLRNERKKEASCANKRREGGKNRRMLDVIPACVDTRRVFCLANNE